MSFSHWSSHQMLHEVGSDSIRSVLYVSAYVYE
jgi:hypothetical protein